MTVHNSVFIPGCIYRINPIKCPGALHFAKVGTLGALFRANRDSKLAMAKVPLRNGTNVMVILLEKVTIIFAFLLSRGSTLKGTEIILSIIFFTTINIIQGYNAK